MSDPIDLPAKAGEWTEEHLNEALRRVCDHERAIARAKADYDKALMRIKEKFEAEKTEQSGGVKALVAAMKKAAQRLREGWANKSVALPWGTISFRKNPPALELAAGRTAEEAIAYLEAHGHGDCVRRDPVLAKEVLERKPAAVIEAAGFRWNEPREVFDYKTKLTLDAEAQPQMKRAG